MDYRFSVVRFGRSLFILAVLAASFRSMEVDAQVEGTAAANHDEKDERASRMEEMQRRLTISLAAP